MPVKVGCASDYNKNHPDRIERKETKKQLSLLPIRDMVGLIVTNILQNWLRALSHTMNGKRAS